MSGISNQQKKDHRKKKKIRSKDWKAKEVKPHLKSFMSPKRERKKEDEIYKLLGDILSKKKERRSLFSYSAKSDV
jgi:hypothetical protein